MRITARWRTRPALRRWLWWSWLLVGLLGCDSASPTPPTAVPLAQLPEQFAATTDLSPTATAVFLADNTPTPAPFIPSPTAPTPEGSGLRPDQAQQNFVRDAGPAPRDADDWRPPPMPAPLAIVPDDHYWLIRPIPSGYRNYDLEWYPFGNDVQAADVPPYRVHHGVDFPNETGTPVLAAGSGTIIHAGSFPSPNNGVNYYGNTVIIHHDWQWQGQDVYTLYAHTLELFVEVGDYVQPGQLIAGVGSSGEVTGPHLHLEVRVGENSYAATRNPALWLVPYEGWGTLAGRLVDSRGRLISDAKIQLLAPGSNEILRQQSTYHSSIASDEVWEENFVVADLPAGEYVLLLMVNDVTYRRPVQILPGRTAFEIIATEFEYLPSPTPLPTATATPTPTGTWTPLETTPTPEGTPPAETEG